jgi:hypothetical protein
MGKRHGGTEENHEKLNQDSWLPGPRIEPTTSWIWKRSVNHSTRAFGQKISEEQLTSLEIYTCTILWSHYHWKHLSWYNRKINLYTVGGRDKIKTSEQDAVPLHYSSTVCDSISFLHVEEEGRPNHLLFEITMFHVPQCFVTYGYWAGDQPR